MVRRNIWAWAKDWKRMWDAFRVVYAQNSTLPEALWKQLDLFAATQFATMRLWALAFSRHDPQWVVEYEPRWDDNGNKLSGYLNQ